MRKNLGLKLFSLMIAIVLAYVVNSTSNSSVIGIVVPIEVTRIPRSKIMVWPPRREVQLTIRGPSFLVAPIAASPPTLQIKLPNDVGNRYNTKLNPSDIVLPPGVSVVSIEPSEMDLMFDDLSSKDVPVDVARVGQLPEGLKLGKVEAIPDSVSVSGPITELRNIKKVETYPVDLREVSKTTEVDLEMSETGARVSISPNKVKARIEVVPIFQERKLDGRPLAVRVNDAHAKYQAEAGTVTVTVAGPKSVIEKLDLGLVIPYIEVGNVPSGTELRVEAEVPEGIKLVSIEPMTVKVRKVSK